MLKKTKTQADVAMIGLGVMGRNFALNMADHGFRVAVHDIDAAAVKRFATENDAIVPCSSLKRLLAVLTRPRRMVMLVPAGGPVDAVIRSLGKGLEKGDVLVDGGNSLWTDTDRREAELAQRGVHFVGSGVSGGEVGARFGPSLMPGGSREAWKLLRPIWNAVAARVDRKTGQPIEGAVPGKPVRGGEPCTAYIGPGGAGHYVKMVHNGIEYGDMQLICEAYLLMAKLLGMKPPEMATVFSDWNKGDLNSFLTEISAEILAQPDPDHPRRWLVDAIRDTAGQKGTGRWTSINALNLGVPAATIAEAVFARTLSARKDERVAAAKKLKGPNGTYRGSRKALIAAIEDALYCSKICSYAQGFALMSEAQREYGIKLDLGKIAKIWRGGCIIRAGFLQKIADAYKLDRKLPNLLLDPYFKRKLRARQAGWRKVVGLAAEHGVPVPAFMSALAYYDGYRSEKLPANLLQAQRDFFGAHSYERLDRPRGQFFHTDWPDPKRLQKRVR